MDRTGVFGAVLSICPCRMFPPLGVFFTRQNEVVLLSTVAGLVSGGAGHSVDGCSSPVPVT
jgi:hypothetical protein